MTNPPPDPQQWQQYSHHQPPQWAATPPPPAPKKKRRWPWIVGGIVLLLVIIGVANSGETVTTRNRPGVPSGVDPNSFNPTPTQVPGGLTVETWTQSPGGWTGSGHADVTSSGPLTSFSDGTYEIGTGVGQVPPGKYRSAKPDAGGIGTCYAATLKNNDGELGDIVDQKVSQGQVLLNVPKPGTVHYVDVRGCTFTKAG